MQLKHEKSLLLAVTLAILTWSGIGPTDRLTWIFEVLPVVIGLALLVPTSRTFPLSMLLYRLLFLHGVILMVGGHYTYAEVPLGEWARESFNLARNHYDRLGHLAQGFVPAILAREILLRQTPLQPGAWLGLIAVCISLAFSAFYEMIEWWAAIALGASAEAMLGTQGDIWDTQWDMFMALTGAVISTGLLSRTHDKSLSQIDR